MRKNRFIDELIERMTLDEKIVQLSCIMPMSISTNQEVDEEKLRKMIPEGVGRMTQFANTFLEDHKAVARAYNRIQQYHIENTRLSIPVIMQDESVEGLVAQDATKFPPAIAMASTWKPELVERVGRIISRQAKAVGIRQCLAPVADVARDSRWGRVGETFGEDPLLVSEFCVAESKGLQQDFYGDNVISCAKHFMGYGASEAGNNCASIKMGEKELKEVYAAPFEAMIKKNDLQSIMVTFSEIDGCPMTINEKYIKDFLVKDLGFDGSVICDGSSITFAHEYNGIGRSKEDIAIRSIKNRIDADTPISNYYKLLKGAVKNGKLEESVIDESVRRILNQKYDLGLFENPYVDVDTDADEYNTESDRQTLREVLENSMILLKNKDHFLPIENKEMNICLFGPFANSIKNIFGGYSYFSHLQSQFSSIYNYKNTKVGGFGDYFNFHQNYEELYQKFEIDNSLSYEENIEKYLRNHFEIESIYDGIKRVFGKANVSCFEGCNNPDKFDAELIDAVETAKKQDILVLCLGEVTGFGNDATSGEGINNPDLRLSSNQRAMIHKFAKLGKKMILLLFNGRGMELTDEEPCFDSILEVWYPGEYGGETIGKILTGAINPSGKLPITFPKYSAQCPLYYSFKQGSGYHQIDEDFFKGFNVTEGPLYPFAHGLSYSSFRYSNLEISESVAIGKDICISFDIENVSEVDGSEIVQVYFRNTNASVNRPYLELRAFHKTELKKHERKRITFRIPTRSLGYYDMDNKFIIEPHINKIFVGSSSEDLVLEGKTTVIGENEEILHNKSYSFSCFEN